MELPAAIGLAGEVLERLRVRRRIGDDTRHGDAVVRQFLHQGSGYAGAEIEEVGGKRGSVDEDRRRTTLDATDDDLGRVQAVSLVLEEGWGCRSALCHRSRSATELSSAAERSEERRVGKG